LLGKYLKLYSRFFDHSITRRDLDLIDDIDKIREYYSLPILKSNSGLFFKSVNELKDTVKSVGIGSIILELQKREGCES
jgi:hypothetical protein